MAEFLEENENKSHLFLNEQDLKILMKKWESETPLIFIEANEDTVVEGYEIDSIKIHHEH